MSRISGLSHHATRVLNQLGRKLTLGGHRYKVRGYFANQLVPRLEHEPFLVPALRRALANHPGAFIDVGVNTGQTFLKLLALDPKRRYVGFEPQLDCAFIVDQFVRDNALAQATVLPMGLSDAPGFLRLYTCQGHDELASTIARDGARETLIPVTTGDAALAALGIDTPGILKIDVEGAEIAVLSGFRETLERARPAVFFEVLPNYEGAERRALPESRRTANTKASQELFRFFDGLGYQVCQISLDGSERRIERFALDDPTSWDGNDYVAWPAERRLRATAA